MTPSDIANISAEIEKMYESMTDELLLNVAAHLRTSTTTWTALHEIETLSNMGQLTEENVAIINEYVQMMPQAIKDAMNESRREALAEIEGLLQKAAAGGSLPYPVTDGTVAVMDAFSKQAADQLNLVNQTMLNSSLEAYQNAIYDYRTQMQKYAPKTIESAADLEAAQNEIDLATGTVVSGQETRTKALRKALVNLNRRGIVGFYDRAGRAWSGEAYVAMDIRTTVHNTYIQTIKTRQNDYGSNVFQVSAHAGARPLCYPYQGKMYSWGDTGGTITLGDGKTYKYEPIKATSYGQPAGLFGINCGHVPYPMIAGVSEPVNEKIQDKEANDKEYAESQKQRALERQIRSAKRQVEMLGDSATEDDKKIIKDAQAAMREFIKQTGRTRRYDREQIVTAKQSGGNSPKRPTVTPNGGNGSKWTTPKRTPKANTTSTAQTTQIVQRTSNDATLAWFSKWAEDRGAKYNPVTKRDTPLSESEIIKLIGGGDKTNGSCASVALCYAGQKGGLNVLDFRGGASQDFFSDEYTVMKLFELPIKGIKETAKSSLTVGNKLLKKVETGKEYYLGVAKHAAIVRKTEDGQLQYLELQTLYDNGWKNFDGNPRHTLATRFGASDRGGGVTHEGVLLEVESMAASQEVAELLGYINTSEAEQNKGKGGYAK